VNVNLPPRGAWTVVNTPAAEAAVGAAAEAEAAAAAAVKVAAEAAVEAASIFLCIFSLSYSAISIIAR